MTALACRFSGSPAARHAEAVQSMLAAMPARGGELRDIWSGDHAALGVSRPRWEAERWLAGATLVARSPRAVVVADGTLCYTDELQARLAKAGVAPGGGDTAELILAAYAAWGDAGTRELEGEFAYAIWDSSRRRALFARDLTGSRTLYYAARADTLLLASHATPLADPGRGKAALNLDVVAATLAALLRGSDPHVYEGVHAVAPGSVMEWTPAGGAREIWRWHPPVFATRGAPDLEEGGVELRRLLVRAIDVRLPPERAAVWMSGGTDSTAVFAAGCSARLAAGAAPLSAVSLTFPSDDLACEDPWIRETTARWNSDVTWVDSEQLDPFGPELDAAVLRDEPNAQAFGHFNSALSKSSRAAGFRVAFGGYGGDSLFQVSWTFLGELLMAGMLGEWKDSLRELELRGTRDVIRWGVLSALPDGALQLLGQVRGRQFALPLAASIPAWLSPGAASRLRSLGWMAPDPARRWFEPPAAFESRWYVTSPAMARAAAFTTQLAQAEGIETRSPLMDRRVIEFAASRPVLERATFHDSKRLLKSAMRGLLPDSVLAPRLSKTGVPSEHLRRKMTASFPELFRRTFGDSHHGQSHLAELGLVDVHALHAAATADLQRAQHLTLIQLATTVATELWLRARL